MPTRGATGVQEILPVFVADVEFEGFSFVAFPVAGSDLGTPLIGRDVLNELIVEFDGPGLLFSLNLNRPGA